MVYACSIIMVLVMILSERLMLSLYVGGGSVGRRGFFRGHAEIQWWFVLMLLAYTPIIGLARVVGLGVEIE